MTRPVIQINLEAIQHNLAVVRRLAPASKIMAMVKANAYGHGAVAVAKALPDADAFAVARLYEAVELREAGIQQEIVVLEGVFAAAELHLAIQHYITLVVHCQEQVELLERELSIQKQQLDVSVAKLWLKIDTGMHRLGVAPADVPAFYNRLRQLVDVVGCMTHFSSADEISIDEISIGEISIGEMQMPSGAFVDGWQESLARATPASATVGQLEVFDQAVAGLPVSVEQSLANSAAIFSLPDAHRDWVRPGLMLYGVSPFAGVSGQELGLRPAMSLYAQILNVRQLHAGESVGYGATWQVTEEPAWVVTIAAGYGDGLPWQLSHTAVNGCDDALMLNTVTESGNDLRLRLVGRVSMDSIAFVLQGGSPPGYCLGERVLLFGQWENYKLIDKSDASAKYRVITISAEDWASASNNSRYSLLTSLSQRCLRR